MARLRAFTALDLTGPLRLQSEDARRGLELWSDDDGIDLEVVDLGASPESAYRDRVGEDILLGPYGSGLVRKALRAVDGSAVMWNHGGSADDLARPWAPMVAAPASGYFTTLVDQAVERGCERLTIVQGGGRFADLVTRGAVQHAERASLPVEVFPLGSLDQAKLSPGGALLVVGRFDEDVAVVRTSKSRLVGCVAAGIDAFGEAAGPSAEGVLGPVQWLPAPDQPEVGPSGEAFAARYQERYASTPSYVAAQAAAAGYLAAAAGVGRVGEPSTWTTTTMLGRFQVDANGLQIGHTVTCVQWRGGRMEPAA
jgi:hypothetical protein